MEKSKVYFTSFHTEHEESPLSKLRRLLTTAGLPQMDLKGKFVAIKIHFGEKGNTAYLRPAYAKVVADLLKEMGARPFLTDCNTLYPGSRRNALDHIETALENGFGPMQVGCPLLIGDGLMGTDDVAVPIEGEYCKEALIGRAVMDAEAIISLNHFKGHEATGIGGALKNLGMGCGSTGGKRAMHHEGKPTVRQKWCIGCGLCEKQCAHGAISFEETPKGRRAFIDHDKCTGCHRCVGACYKRGAILGPDSSNDILNCKIAEYAWAVIKDRPNFHISLVMDVSPRCDCYGGNDTPVIPDLGMFASFDPVALDTACADACNKAPRISCACEGRDTGDLFTDIAPVTNWRVAVEHGEKLGMGSTEYELIEVQ